MDIDDEIDKYLKRLFEARDFTMFANELYKGSFFMYNTPHPIDRAMLGKGLITEEKDARMLTERGIKISQLGGWNVYLNLERESERKKSEEQTELQSLTKKQLELSIREMQVNFTQIKYWWLILLATTIASAGLGVLLQAIF